MRWWVLLVVLVAPSAWSMSADVTARLCGAAAQDGALAGEIEGLADRGQYPFQSAEELLTLDCGVEGILLRVLVTGAQAENLEYAVIDMGANVNLPLVQEEGGKLSIVQYLLQQAALASQPAVRAFAMDYMRELRDVDFNPNLLWISMN